MAAGLNQVLALLCANIEDLAIHRRRAELRIDSLAKVVFVITQDRDIAIVQRPLSVVILIVFAFVRLGNDGFIDRYKGLLGVLCAHD